MEERIASPKKTIEILQSTQFQFLKKYGQNFLIDLHVLDKIVSAADLGKDDIVLEIGPGIGSLTQALAERARRVIAVEIDDRLIPILRQNLADYDNVELIHADFLKLDLSTLDVDRPVKVIANLPYYITTPIIMRLFEGALAVSKVCVMVQEEVAARMQAGPGTKEYGALSLAIGYYATARIVAYVPKNCFMPRPGVGSAVVLLDAHEKTPVDVTDEKMMFRIIKAAFGQRRKTLINALSGSPDLTVDKADVEAALQTLGLPAQVRGEALRLDQFAALSNVLAK